MRDLLKSLGEWIQLGIASNDATSLPVEPTLLGSGLVLLGVLLLTTVIVLISYTAGRERRAAEKTAAIVGRLVSDHSGGGPNNLRPFISYSRKESKFARRLFASLENAGFKPIIDTADIAPNDLWRDRLDSLLLEADAVVFVLSPGWARSEVCRWEFRRAAEFGKLLAPIVWRAIAVDRLPKELSARNFVYFNTTLPVWKYGRQRYSEAVSRLVRALRIADEQWRRTHARLVIRANQWRESGFKEERLLSGGETSEAQRWAAAKPNEEDELPPLLVQFVEASVTAREKLTEIQKAVLGELDLVGNFANLPNDHIRRLPTALVVADYGVIPYDDSRGLKADLQSWAMNPSYAHAAGRLYAAAGGYGKTRLALEAVTALRAAGWRAGILPRASLEKTDVRGEHDADARLKRFFDSRGAAGALLVIDYAEGRVGQIERVTRAALTAPEGGPIRILLLARSAGEWWEDLHKESREIQLVYDRNSVATISSDIAPERRAIFFRSAAAAFAEILAAAQSDDDPLLSNGWETRPIPTSRLTGAGIGSPLSLAFEAFLHVRGVDAKESPLAEMAREERRHWARALKIKAGDVVRMNDSRIEAMHRVAAVLTLTQGMPAITAAGAEHSLDQALETALKPMHLPQVSEVGRARTYAEVRKGIDALYRHAGPSGDVLRPVLPDLLGERIVGEVLARTPQLLGDVLDHQTDAAFPAFTVLSRATREGGLDAPVHSLEEVVVPIDQALRQVLPERLARVADPLMAVASLERGSLSMRAEEALNSLDAEGRARASLAILRAAGDYVDPNSMPSRVRGLLATAAKEASVGASAGSANQSGERQADDQHVRAVFLARTGDFTRALEAEGDAVRLYRRLLEHDPLRFKAKLAEGLNNLANRLADLGRRDDALAPSKEAVAHWRELVAIDPPPHLDGLATALSNLSARLFALGQSEEGVATAVEAVGIYRRMVTANGDLGRPQLAYSLSMLANWQSSIGRFEDALSSSSESTNLYRQLVAKDRDRYLPRLAATLTGLARDLGNREQRDEALIAAQESVSLYRETVPTTEELLPPFAAALVSLSTRLSFLRRYGEASAASAEAIAILRSLAEDNAEAFRPDLAGALMNANVALSNLGKQVEAHEACTEAVEIYRALAKSESGPFAAWLARALISLGSSLAQAGRNEEACLICEEAVARSRELNEKGHDTFLPDLATAVRNLASCLAKLGRSEEALRASEECVELQRRLIASDRSFFLEGLATSLGDLATDLSSIGRDKDALAASQERVQLFRELTETNRNLFLPNLAHALLDLGVRLSRRGRHDEASTVIEESVAAHREIKTDDQRAYFLGLALCAQGDVLSAADRSSAAAVAFEEGIGVLAQARSLSPEDVDRRVGHNLISLKRELRKVGLADKQIQARMAAVLRPAS